MVATDVFLAPVLVDQTESFLEQPPFRRSITQLGDPDTQRAALDGLVQTRHLLVTPVPMRASRHVSRTYTIVPRRTTVSY
jgi:hypothetical protein